MWRQLLESLIRAIFSSKSIDDNPTSSNVVSEAIPKSEITQSEGIPKAVKKLCFAISSSFEGSDLGKIGFDNITGNFDGEGLSIGFLQFCTGQDSDRELFQKMYQRHPDVLKSCLGDLYDGFVATLTKSKQERLAWAISINNPNNRIKEPWKSRLLALCRTPEFQEIQMEMAEGRIQAAAAICHEFGLKSIRAFALCFDIVVQNGSIGKDAKARISARKGETKTERELLAVIVDERVKDARPRFQADVRKRKMCIVNGHGTVHGQDYDLDSIGLSDATFIP